MGGFSRDTGGKGAAVYPGVREKGGIRRGLVVRVPRAAVGVGAGGGCRQEEEEVGFWFTRRVREEKG